MGSDYGSNISGAGDEGEKEKNWDKQLLKRWLAGSRMTI
jgi:hypothetical protein